MKILFIDTVHPILVEKLKLAGHVCIDGTAMSRTEILGIVSTCDGVVIRSRMRIDREFLEASRGLKFIARAGAGMENID
ncbi:MAG: hydroxyacid dehydrogenase, partial [Bacteroidia bacterium]|nr:hydroxyacid dehydrogenase [Bacteroidia bacterium]